MPQDIDARDIVRAAAEALAPRADARAITIDIAGLETAPVSADPMRLRQVVDNLLSNAITYNRDGGTVFLGTTTDGTSSWILVRDTGVGISDADRSRLFQRFYKAGTPRRAGTGLGLAITRDIVRAHGGDIGLHSSPGVGSTFIVKLPAAAPARRPRASRRNGARDPRSHDRARDDRARRQRERHPLHRRDPAAPRRGRGPDLGARVPGRDAHHARLHRLGAVRGRRGGRSRSATPPSSPAPDACGSDAAASTTGGWAGSSAVVASRSSAPRSASLVEGPDGGDWAGALWMFIPLLAFAAAGAVECLRGALRRVAHGVGARGGPRLPGALLRVRARRRSSPPGPTATCSRARSARSARASSP